MVKGLSNLKTALKSEGLRFTAQRQAVWEEIVSNDEHRDADEIYLAIRQKKDISVSRATVYRTIDVLVKNNLARRMDVGIGPSKYEHKFDTPHHDHIICIKCGLIEEFVEDEIEDLQEKVAREYGYKLIRHIHQLFGLCKKCQ